MFLILRTGSGVGSATGDHDNRLALESCDEIAVGPHQWRHRQREFVGLCRFLWPQKDGAPKPKELVAPKPKSWFVRQKVLGANMDRFLGPKWLIGCSPSA